MSVLPIVIPIFTGKPLDYSAYNLSLIRAAINSERVSGGLLSQVLAAPAYLKSQVCRTLGGDPFVSPTVPVKPVGDAATPQANLEYNAACVRFDSFEQDTKRFKTALENSLPEPVQTFLVEDNDDKELHELSIRDIIGSLDDKYASGARSADILTLKAKLQITYSPSLSDVDSFIASHHTKVHKELKKFNIEMSQFDKIDALEKALVSCGDYKDCIKFFKLTYPNTTDVNRNFLQFAQNIREYEPEARATAGSNSYSAASATESTDDISPHDLKKILFTMQQQITTMSHILAAPHHSAAAAASAPTPVALEYPEEYCWTHGQCFHPGNLCMQRNKGHVESATLANKCGGEEKVSRPRPVLRRRRPLKKN